MSVTTVEHSAVGFFWQVAWMDAAPVAEEFTDNRTGLKPAGLGFPLQQLVDLP
jgi:hypothetical protein